MDWDNVHCLRFWLCRVWEERRQAIKQHIHAPSQALGPLASHMEINRPFASCPPIVFNPPSIDKPEESRTA